VIHALNHTNGAAFPATTQRPRLALYGVGWKRDNALASPTGGFSVTNLRAMIVVLTFSRLVLNMTRRFAYPFIPAIALALDTPVSGIQSALAVSWGVGLLSPLFGSLSERYGRRPVMIATVALMALVSLLGALVNAFWAFALVVVVYGIGKMIFDPALQAYIGERIPFAQRARVWGAIELSWSGALFVAAPLTGLLLQWAGLQPVFVILGVLMALSAILIRWTVPDGRPAAAPVAAGRPWAAFGLLWQRPRALAALGYSVCLVTAQEIFFINYALWMQESFHLLLATLGVATIALGLGEACGELLVSIAGDRVGLHRMALYGALAAGGGFALLPYLNQSLPVALVGLFIVITLLEMAIVAAITLFTEVLPDARALMMSANISAMSLGRVIGALIGGSLIALTQDFALTGLVTMGFILAGCGLMVMLRTAMLRAAAPESS
jgi:predicted MFS family arabinose efflux permease